MARETEQETNAALYLLEALAREYQRWGADFRKEYYLDVTEVTDESASRGELNFVASCRDLLIAFQVLAKHKGFRLPFLNPLQLSVRLANEASVLETAGWTWTKAKTINGARYHRFARRLEK